MFASTKKTVKNFLKIDDQLWARVVETRETRKLILSLESEKFDVLEISGTRWQNFNFKSYKSSFYPDYDVCKAPLGENFDLIIAEHVFEHLLWPYRGGKNIYEMLNPKGYFLIVTPFLNRIHSGFADCSRWTETGLKYFLAECGFPLENTQTNSWGNRACVKANLNTRNWARHKGILQPMHNEEKFPCVVWALTQKN